MHAQPPIAIGQVLAEKYEIEAVLGAGGMGVVTRARHLQLGESVAIKFLLPQALQDAEAVARFEREAQIAVRIRSEHVARTLDVGHLEDGTPYIVMEYLQGLDLAQHLARNGRFEVSGAVDLVLQAAEALAEAHAAGIVHRDLKPANLFLTHRADGSNCVKLLDFGISKWAETSAPSGLTQTNATLGTPLYMSPEQLASTRTVDARTDIWSLGIIVYELASNRPPFNGTSLATISAAILTQPTPNLADECASAPSALCRAIECALQKDPEQRYANLYELAKALAPHGTAEASRSLSYIRRVLGASPGASSGEVTEVSPSGSAPASPATGSGWSNAGRMSSPPAAGAARWRRLRFAAAVAVLGAGLAAWFWPVDAAPPPAPERAVPRVAKTPGPVVADSPLQTRVLASSPPKGLPQQVAAVPPKPGKASAAAPRSKPKPPKRSRPARKRPSAQSVPGPRVEDPNKPAVSQEEDVFLYRE